ncbi:MAG TPA: zinc-dependent metalloprotease family protein, partial [Blastocatellia bacterium]|nr:zinc-dependent metalloprotease family protein [Blastocatellia bacterium]
MKTSHSRARVEQKPFSHLHIVLVIALAASICSVGLASVSGSGDRQSPGQSSTNKGSSNDGIWRTIDSTLLTARVESSSPRTYQSMELNKSVLTSLLSNVPMEFTEAAKRSRGVISLPMPDGTFERFAVEESPVMESELAAQFPEIKSYRGQGLDDPTATTRFDLSPLGFHATILSAKGCVYVEPYTARDTQHYLVYFKEQLQDGFTPPQCEVSEELQGSLAKGLENLPVAIVGTSLRTYRLALATTVEYTNNSTYGGGKSATLTKLNTIVNLINAIYEREVSIRFQLVAGELSIIFDAEPDGYTNSNVSTMLSENPGVLNTQLGSANYDIGHVFGLSNPGSSSGVAQVGVVCSANKGASASVLGIALVTGNFSIDSGLVAHEWGHQFSARHTFNSSSGNCGLSGQRSSTTSFEPGSGSTLMAYPGSCSPENLQQNSDNYFLGGSFDQIANYAAGAGAACAAATTTGNNPPTISAGADFTIPISTPFTLTASATDPDGDPLTYSWEELDLGNPSPPMTDDGTRPLFRSFNATTSPSRTFPKLSDILNNTSTIGEMLPTTTRSMNFRVTARDNRAGGGGVSSDAIVLNVSASAGPFVVTAPNSSVTWTGNTTQNVTWNVANTASSPVNCSNVKISLSTNGGNTFPIVLSASTPNDGSEPVSVPNISTGSARIKVEAVGNVFFDVSNTNFTVTQGSTNGVDTIGLYNPSGAAFFLRNSITGGIADVSFAYGPVGLIPLSGDWNGDGIDTTGLYNPATGAFFLRNSNSGGVADISFPYGPAGAGFIPIVGDWNGDGIDTIGLYNPAAGAFFLRNSNSGGVADISFAFGPAGAGFIPIVGDWDGNGTDTVGLYNPATGGWFLRNTNSGGVADITFAFGPGGAGW